MFLPYQLASKKDYCEICSPILKSNIKLKTDNLCCPTIAKGNIKDGENILIISNQQVFPQNIFSEEETTAESSCSNCMQLKAIEEASRPYSNSSMFVKCMLTELNH